MESNKVNEFIENWKADFIDRMHIASKSKSQRFRYRNAIEVSSKHETELDKVMIKYIAYFNTVTDKGKVEFIDKNPLLQNDYFKFVNSYKNGKKLNDKYFRHDKKKLEKYYSKIDADPKGYNPFCEHQYKKYVLFMMLKFSEAYESEFDEVFNAGMTGSREYNPLTSIPSVLRQSLPFEIKEYDIAQAYPSFIFMELNIEPFDVYSLIDKKKFNILLNTHSKVKGATIEGVRAKLEPIYKDRVNEVITEERFNEKGRLFNDLAKYEAEFIQKFVETNEPEYFVRLHDGVVTFNHEELEILDFDNIKFKVKSFEVPAVENEIVNFYDVSNNTSPAMYKRFFIQEGFISISQVGNDKYVILKNENRILTPFNHKTEIVDFLTKHINEFNTDELENRIAREAQSVIQQSYNLLPVIELEYHKDTREQVDIPFKNGVLRITKDGQEVIPTSEIKGFFANHDTLKFDYEIRDYRMSDFEKFLIMAITNKNINETGLTDEDNKKLLAFYSMFGYLVSNYKDGAESPAIILSDEDANDRVRNGRRGKSIFLLALKLFRKSIEKQGKAYDPNYTHVHADLKQEHDLYLIDDVPANFDYNALYTNITGSIDAQRKGTVAETIDFKDAPKFVITTNWAVRYDKNAGSTNSRFIEYQFSNFFNSNHEPKEVFEKRFFDDWNKDDWNDFYSFGASCVQLYLKDGLQRIEYDKRKDNYSAYFHDEVIEDEMKRILSEMIGLRKFTVSDFLKEHKKDELFYRDQYFHRNNTKKLLEIYFEYNNEPFHYSKRGKCWEYVM